MANKENATNNEKSNSQVKVSTLNIILKLIGIAALALLVFFVASLFIKKEEVNIRVSSILKETRVISELQTLMVPYNSILLVYYPKKNDTDADKLRYCSAYQGTVTFGMNLKKIDVSVDNETKVINVLLPEIRIQETYVAPESVETIYKDTKLKTEMAFLDRRKECDEDLRNKANNDAEVKELARKTAISTVENLLKPIVNKLYSDYEIVVN